MWGHPVPVPLGFCVGLPWLPCYVLFILHSWQCSWSPFLAESSFTGEGSLDFTAPVLGPMSSCLISCRPLAAPSAPLRFPQFGKHLCAWHCSVSLSIGSTRAAPLTDQDLLPGLVFPQFLVGNRTAQYVLF